MTQIFDLSGKVAIVTGANTGIGQAIALSLAAAGANIAAVGRTPAEETVAQVHALGRRAEIISADLSSIEPVQRVVDETIEKLGRLDILVNNAAAVYPDALMAPGGFWEKPLKLSDMIDVGLRSNYVAAYYASPMMVAAKRGLIASISFYGSVSYFHGAAYGAAKAGTDKMMRDMAVDLAPHNVAAVSIWPGFILTDAVKAIPPEFLPEDLRANLPNWETPEFTGLVIDALARDPDIMSLSGQALIGAELGERYRIVDLDGKQPISYRATMGAPANH